MMPVFESFTKLPGNIYRLSSNQNSRFAFSVITSLFFLWGFTTVNNDILIPWYETTFELSDTGSMLVNLAFFGSYGLWSLLYFIYSITKGDPINKLGYKNGAVLGLVISSVACFLFYPATNTGIYWVCLMPLFLLGLGFTLLQISCNPYIAILGPQESASSRLNLSQGFNSLGTTIGPMILGFLILKYFSGNEAVQIPYAILGAIFACWALFIFFLRMPDFKQNDTVKLPSSALKYRHLRLGMFAVFFMWEPK